MEERKRTKEILTSAVKKALDNGFTGFYLTHTTVKKWYVDNYMQLHIEFSAGETAKFHMEQIIFNPSFAQNLWGKKWKYHVKKMAIENNRERIQYLGAHI